MRTEELREFLAFLIKSGEVDKNININTTVELFKSLSRFPPEGSNLESKVVSNIAKTREYLDYIEVHYLNVQKACKLVFDNCSDMSFMQDPMIKFRIIEDVLNHDLSKLSPEEFIQYRMKFFPTASELNKESKDLSQELFKSAWDHHKINNLHHWQSWTKEGPENVAYIVMNVIDWVAMGFEFNNTAQSYYEKNKDTIDIPEPAVDYMYQIFQRIY